MCTIMTLDKTIWQSQLALNINQIETDAIYNSDGWTLLAVDFNNPDKDTQISVMSPKGLVNFISTWFNGASINSRIFLHARMATTGNVGIAFNHGFTDFHGRIIMHNGVIGNPNQLAVDSFGIAAMPLDSAVELMDELVAREETFANVFVIDPQFASYSVVRLSHSTLFTDGFGNYSTNRIGDIVMPVAEFTATDHYDQEFVGTELYSVGY